MLSVGFMSTFGGGLRPLVHVLVYFLCVVVFCEYVVYYVVLLQCSWPQLEIADAAKADGVMKPLKVVVVADTHLLGPTHGHWFDKLRREWQMYRSFQTMLAIYNPQVVFFLGDLFDEGLWTNEKEFNDDVARFRSLFHTPPDTSVYAVAGNHDVGFHYSMTPHLNQRFVKTFKAPPVHLLVLNGNVFVLVNSMAMEGDDCFLCLLATKRLKRISAAIQCANGKLRSSECEGLPKIPANSRPILLQHFPMFRESDISCDGIDAAPLDDKAMPFRETWECLSKNASEQLLEWLHPRAIFGGHTHHGCLVIHPPDIPEWSVPSFSWRNRNNPSFLLVSVTPQSHAVSKCFLPQESTVVRFYLVAFFAFVALFVFFKCSHCWPFVHQKITCTEVLQSAPAKPAQ